MWSFRIVVLLFSLFLLVKFVLWQFHICMQWILTILTPYCLISLLLFSTPLIPFEYHFHIHVYSFCIMTTEFDQDIWMTVFGAICWSRIDSVVGIQLKTIGSKKLLISSSSIMSRAPCLIGLFCCGPRIDHCNCDFMTVLCWI